MSEERENLIKYTFPKLKKFCDERGVFLTQSMHQKSEYSRDSRFKMGHYHWAI